MRFSQIIFMILAAENSAQEAQGCVQIFDQKVCWFKRNLEICEEWELKEGRGAREGADRPVVAMKELVRADEEFEQFYEWEPHPIVQSVIKHNLLETVGNNGYYTTNEWFFPQ